MSIVHHLNAVFVRECLEVGREVVCGRLGNKSWIESSLTLVIIQRNSPMNFQASSIPKKTRAFKPDCFTQPLNNLENGFIVFFHQSLPRVDSKGKGFLH